MFSIVVVYCSAKQCKFQAVNNLLWSCTKVWCTCFNTALGYSCHSKGPFFTYPNEVSNLKSYIRFCINLIDSTCAHRVCLGSSLVIGIVVGLWSWCRNILVPTLGK